MSSLFDISKSVIDLIRDSVIAADNQNSLWQPVVKIVYPIVIKTLSASIQTSISTGGKGGRVV